MVSNCVLSVEKPQNEAVLSYAPGTPEKTTLKKRLAQMKAESIDIPLIIGGREVRTGDTGTCVVPHENGRVLGTYHVAGPTEVQAAIRAALAAKSEWENLPWEHRASIFLKAAQMVSGPWRSTLNAATMLGQSKTALQAEIDAACEVIDYLSFGPYYLSEIYQEQPACTGDAWNRMEYRPLEGFVLAVSPFNFTAIAANLACTPAMAGNVVIWKPASTAVYSGYHLMKLLQAAGLPDGVINFVPGPGGSVTGVALADERLAGVHFTGSTSVFQDMWSTVAHNLRQYRTYPRLVGETGGKGFIFAHSSADHRELVAALVRGAFEYQGQKCSAASRAYIPESLWPSTMERLVECISSIRVGDVTDFTNFMGAVIDQKAFNSIKSYIDFAREAGDAQIIAGGGCDDSEGFFIQPTVILTTNPRFKTMREEIFGPVLTIYVYRDSDLEQALDLCDTTSPYGLTGAIFARERQAISYMEHRLSATAGNFYINDKPTGAVVGQQPFGGARASGTNEKAGSKLNMLRWISPRTIKENLAPGGEYGYPHMLEP